LGWCTWDAFYHDVSAQGIAAGLQSFNDAGVKPRWIIIDDGWQVRAGMHVCWQVRHRHACVLAGEAQACSVLAGEAQACMSAGCAHATAGVSIFLTPQSGCLVL
jgi:hypothetical protein